MYRGFVQQEMALDHLQAKWRLWYTLLDVNHDGKISWEDAEAVKESLPKHLRLEGVKAEKVKEQIDHLWKTYIFRRRPAEMDIDGFVKAVTDDYKSDKHAFRAEINEMFETFFPIIDSNDDNIVSFEDYAIGLKAHGFDDEAMTKKLYALYRVEGQSGIPVSVLKDDWVDFVCGEDPGSPNQIFHTMVSNMALKHLQAKWRLWFNLLDVNHDGKISWEDVESSKAIMTRLHRLEGAKATKVKEQLDQVWRTYIFRKRPSEMDIEVFVKALTDDYQADKSKFRAEIRDNFEAFFPIIDSNDDNKVSFKDYVIAFKAHGFNDEAMMKKLYSLYGVEGQDGIPLSLLQDDWVDFVCGEDPRSPNPMFQAMVASMELEHLQAKWRLWFNLLDVNHDGKISWEDVESSKAIMTRLHRLEGAKATKVKEQLDQVWRTYIFRKRPSEMDIEVFVKAVTEDYQADKAKFRAEIRDNFEAFFPIIDSNDDNKVSFEDYVIAFQAHGFNDEALTKKLYSLYGVEGQDGIALSVLQDDWVDFVCGEDPRSPNPMFQAMVASMALEHLQAKWRLWYTLLDVNHDGKISWEDVESVKATMTRLHRLEGAKAKTVKEQLDQLWKTYIFKKRPTEMDIEVFVKAATDDYQADKAKFRAEVSDFFGAFFPIIDSNDDNKVSFEDYVIAFQAHGFNDEAMTKKLYALYRIEGQDGIPLSVLQDDWIDFVCGEDQSSPNQMFQAMVSK